jgi:hypothetical protein
MPGVLSSMIKIHRDTPVNLGTMACDLCHLPMDREEQIVGLLHGMTFDIYRCSRCEQMVWQDRKGSATYRKGPPRNV